MGKVINSLAVVRKVYKVESKLHLAIKQRVQLLTNTHIHEVILPVAGLVNDRLEHSLSKLDTVPLPLTSVGLT